MSGVFKTKGKKELYISTVLQSTVFHSTGIQVNNSDTTVMYTGIEQLSKGMANGRSQVSHCWSGYLTDKQKNDPCGNELELQISI